MLLLALRGSNGRRPRMVSEVPLCDWSPGLCRLDDDLILEHEDCLPGDVFRTVESCRELTPLGKLMPGNSSSVSCRGPGVAVVSTRTTDRIGKTRSVISGLRGDLLGAEFGDDRGFVAPEKILTGLLRGIIPRTAVCWGIGSGDASDDER